MQQTALKGKLNNNARHFRYVSRAQAFQQRRKKYDQLDYLAHYQSNLKTMILASMESPIPDPLPPLTVTSISFYRRSSRPVFMTHNPQTSQLDGHMLYESLWILGSLQQKMFQDYPSIVKEFQSNFSLYLSANSNDIRQMAVIAAGNKIIGKEEDILNIVERDPRQLWVLANHIYENKISFSKLFPFLSQTHQVVFKTLFELSMLMQQEVAEQITGDTNVLELLVKGVNTQNQNIRKYSMRIIGNIIAVKNEAMLIVTQMKLLDLLLINLSCTNGQIRRDTCWLITNVCTKKNAATQVIKNRVLLEKLINLFTYETLYNIKKELTYVFCHLVFYADKKQALTTLAHPNMLQLCYSQLTIEDPDLNIVTLLLIKQMIELGDSLPNEEQENIVINMLKQAHMLWNQISKKSYSENNQVSSISLEIIGSLQEDQ